ncbi:thioredoxin domain-containing protein [Gordonia sp. HY002]|uniref:DsbA family protein n=1 Tax=Gordonia zhenghanii TaxID=2911516 RepID=UPI001EF0B6D3|nr:thioredoxin domain-containing protein [Gordonia zhenghanii]MCF8568786.1 thioredoxin domain-containing protein [Gordonia zhenghanii]MCF8606119.1 thioredoxin domain-containing protein [Gordonia zhenghanii]
MTVRSRAARAVALGGLAATGALLVGACTVDGTPVSDGSTSTETGASGSDGSTSTPSGPSVTSNGSFRVTAAPGQPKVIVTVIEDLGCPACQKFEAIVGPTLDGYADDTEVAIDYKVISFLDRVYPDHYSSRAANASYCVWHSGDGSLGSAQTWRKFQSTTFGRQPTEGGPGLTDDELAAIAKQSGAPDVAGCITGGQYANEVSATTDETTDDSEFKGTPTVLVNGKEVTVTSAADVEDAVDAAKR